MIDITRNYHGGNPQSNAAHGRTNKERDGIRVFQYIWSCGITGSTCYEVEQALGLRHQTCSARVTDLKRETSVYGTGRTRDTDTGSPAEVYIAYQHLQDFVRVYGAINPKTRKGVNDD